MPVTAWLCPACHQPLALNSRQWRCEQGHSFDQAKQGYVNLLLAQHKNSKDPGDNKDMVNARRNFLSQGYYQPLADRMAELLQQHLEQNVINLFDAGCGEGYYLNHIRQRLLPAGKVLAQGIDISKVAIQKAAKAHVDINFAVASSFSLPLASESIHGLIQVFAPSSEQEVRRVLTTTGLWLKVDPAAQHLTQLKSMLYQQAQTHNSDELTPVGFELVTREKLAFSVELNSAQQRLALLQMTPFYWSARPELVDRVMTDLHQVDAHFDIRLFRKNHD